VLPFSNRGRSARQKPVVHRRIVAPAVVNEALILFWPQETAGDADH